MNKSVFALGCVIVAACSGGPTADAGSAGTFPQASFARGGTNGEGAQFLTVNETGVDAELPTGICSFRADGSGNFNNFLRTSPNGTRFLKIQDASGSVEVITAGSPGWRGTGRVNVTWPDYPGGNSFEMTMVGDHDANGDAASCKYKIANGVPVVWYIKTK